MRKFLLILSITISGILSAQTVKQLDEKNGFKNYKLGTNKNNLEKNTNVLLIRPNYLIEKKNTYQVLNHDSEVFGFPIDVLWFEFDKNNNLATIIISLNVEKDITFFENNFEHLFGEAQYSNTDANGWQTTVWKGNKVQLEIVYAQTDYNIDGMQAIISIKSLSYIEEQIKDGF